MLIVGNLHLFSDAEVGEDVGEEVGGGDCAGEGGEVVECFADVLGYEVSGYVVAECPDGLPDGSRGCGERLVVTEVCDCYFTFGGRGGSGYL